MNRYAVAALIAALPLSAAAQDSRSVSIPRNDIPRPVSDLVTCGTEPEHVDRRPFAGAFIFSWPCPGNHANWMTTLVIASGEDGAGARLLRLPPPRGKAWDESANVEFFDRTRELTQITVDPEQRRVCRSEGRWRLEGPMLQPRLMFWRETRDCEGRKGWRILVRNGRRMK